MAVPEFLAQLLPRNYISGILQEAGEYAEGLVLQFDADPMLAQFSGSKIQFKHAKAHSPRCTFQCLHAVPSGGCWRA
jgi:hypothetical protein